MTCRPFCLDPGTSEKSTTGWAYWDGSQLHSGIWNLTLAGPSLDAKLVYFSKRVRHGLINFAPSPSLLVIEQPGMMAGNHTAVEALHSLVGIVRLWSMAMLDRPARLIHPSTLKKATTGSGRADKRAMMQAVRNRHEGIDLKDDNQADAVAMCDLILAEERGTGAPDTPMLTAMRKVGLRKARGRKAG